MIVFYKKVLAKYIVVVADFKTVEKKFLDQGEDKEEITKYLDIFKKLRDRNKLSPEEKNIDLWGKKPFKEFKERLDELDQEKTNTEKRKGAVNTAKEIPGAKKIKEDDNWVVYDILTNGAAAELGQGTEWCIRFNPSNYWKEYSKKYAIYYLISKTLPTDNPWAKIAFLIDGKGQTSYWDAHDKKHQSPPNDLGIPNFITQKPIWNIDVSKSGLTKLESVSKETRGYFDCSENNLTSLEGAPDIVRGSFACHINNLTSLEGAPKEVGHHFLCSHNNITSLKGAPKEVRGDFNCNDNKLTSLEHAPEKVGKTFSCSGNELTSLEGSPKTVGRDFDCSYNHLSSLKGSPKQVGGDFDCSGNHITSLEGAPDKIKNFDCSYNQLTSLLGAPKKVIGDFNCSGNDLTSLEYAPKYVGRDFYCEEMRTSAMMPKKITEEDVRSVCDVKGKVYV